MSAAPQLQAPPGACDFPIHALTQVANAATPKHSLKEK